MAGAASLAAPTTLVVRAKAKDAKFIGSSMGGALIVVRESKTGRVLASGITHGGTGDTVKIMKKPHARGDMLSDEKTAGFSATLEIDEPVRVTIEAYAPYGGRKQIAKSSTEVWLIPGKNITGDGVVLEFPGFSVDVLAPQAAEKVKLEDGRVEVPIRANVVMMCGCPTEPGGLWDSRRYEVEAIIMRDGKRVAATPLHYAGRTSTYEGSFTASEPGDYEVVVYSYDPHTGNTGVDASSFTVSDR
jgi:hypothetical protein